ncbi:hypothetical protein PF002_g22316 [Phytophthora fragariae]|uniref:Uncharacterized protein n=1 Tax=Phytophthora fragariae TaxID=53985 RepID=A0A6A3XAQ2_9STRA|nr:hypothetical protein PF002_g22316 [Phytophthora fragariae]
MDRNKKVGPDAWRAHREGSTAGEVSHYGTCRSGGIGLILRFVPLRKSPAWKEAKLATAAPPPPPRPAAAAAAAAAAALPGSMKVSRALATSGSSGGRSWGRASSAWKPSQPLPHRHNDQQQQRQQQRRTKLGPGKPRLEGRRASHYRTTTTTSSGGSSSSSIAG